MNTNPLYTDFPFDEVTKEAERLINEGGNILFQKWTCPFCDERITMGTPNIFYTQGRHEDCTVNPTALTDLRTQGCNYMMVQANKPKGQDILSDLRNLG